MLAPVDEGAQPQSDQRAMDRRGNCLFLLCILICGVRHAWLQTGFSVIEAGYTRLFSVIFHSPQLPHYKLNCRRTKWWSNWWAASAPRSGLRLPSSCPGALASSAESAGTTISTRPSTRILGPRKRTGTCCRVLFSLYFNARFCLRYLEEWFRISVRFLFSTVLNNNILSLRCLYTELSCWSTVHRATGGQRSPRSCTAAPTMRSRTTGIAP